MGYNFQTQMILEHSSNTQTASDFRWMPKHHANGVYCEAQGLHTTLMIPPKLALCLKSTPPETPASRRTCVCRERGGTKEGILYSLYGEYEPGILKAQCTLTDPDGTPGTHQRSFVVFLSSARQMPEYYLDYATTASFQILSNSSIIIPSDM
jgi:hypothetical protein